MATETIFLPFWQQLPSEYSYLNVHPCVLAPESRIAKEILSPGNSRGVLLGGSFILKCNYRHYHLQQKVEISAKTLCANSYENLLRNLK